MMSSVPRLTCERCKKRKIKCSKFSPCSACLSAGVPCQSVQRARLPRGKSGRVLKNTLESRVARIESLLKQARASNDGFDCATNAVNGTAGQYNSSLSSSKTSEFMAPEFWNTLSQEVSGLRETFDSSDDEGESPLTSETLNSGSGDMVILFGPSTSQALPDVVIPFGHVRTVLLDLYKQRVDCIYKILHWPTVLRDIRLTHEDSEKAAQSPSALALEYAIYFMALCSITDEEAASFNLGNRPKMLHQYRVATERYISNANLLRKPNLTVLQAFVIYLIGLRAHRNCASEWMLLATAVRVATALRLGQEVPASYSAFDLEIRRRLWHGIGVIDTHASLDRGTTPMIQYNDLGPAPLCIDDKDMSPKFVPTSSSSGFTEMSFFSMTVKSMLCQKKMLAMPGTTLEEWEKKLKLVQEFERSLHHSYCNIDTSASLLERLANFVAMEITVSMHLLLRRPPYKQLREAVPTWDDFDVMKVATTILERQLQIKTAEFKIWAWKSWVQWYALAVVLAELLSRPPGPDTESAFLMASECFDRSAQVIADSASGLLWKPIVKLMRRVRNLRGDIPLNPCVKHSDAPTASSMSSENDASGAADLNISRLGFHEPMLKLDENLGTSGWHADDDALNTFRNGIDLNMDIYDDPQLNWDLFLDEVNFDDTIDFTNVVV